MQPAASHANATGWTRPVSRSTGLYSSACGPHLSSSHHTAGCAPLPAQGALDSLKLPAECLLLCLWGDRGSPWR